MNLYAQQFTASKPQSEKAHPKQQQNNADGYSFVITPWQRLERFLMLHNLTAFWS
jgi:hypothetical protein